MDSVAAGSPDDHTAYISLVLRKPEYKGCTQALFGKRK